MNYKNFMTKENGQAEIIYSKLERDYRNGNTEMINQARLALKDYFNKKDTPKGEKALSVARSMVIVLRNSYMYQEAIEAHLKLAIEGYFNFQNDGNAGTNKENFRAFMNKSKSYAQKILNNKGSPDNLALEHTYFTGRNLDNLISLQDEQRVENYAQGISYDEMTDHANPLDIRFNRLLGSPFSATNFFKWTSVGRLNKTENQKNVISKQKNKSRENIDTSEISSKSFPTEPLLGAVVLGFFIYLLIP